MTDLFTQLVDFENLHAAYLDARACKRYRTSVLKFGYALEENLLALRSELACKTYRHGGYREFVVNDSKKRLIKAAPFRDRLKFAMHPRKAEIFPIERGVDFLGYVLRDGKCFLRKSTVKRFMKKRRRYITLVERGEMDGHFFENINMSWRGYAAFATSYKLMEKLGVG